MVDDPELLRSKLGSFSSGTESEPVHLKQDEDTGDRFVIYSTASGIEVQLRYERDALWMTQAQIADLFGVERSVITKHLRNIYDEGELDESATSAKIAQVRLEGARQVTREIQCYDWNVVISVGYRVSSKQATMFRVWATDKLVQFATKGFVVDVERLKAPNERDHFKELREVIREIRASEANVYRELRQIISLCSDYEALSEKDKTAFFAATQNRLLFAVTGMTAPEIRVERARASWENMGLTSWKGRGPSKRDIVTAKNYLGEAEIRDLNRFTNMLLDYFEQETDLQRLVLTADAERAVAKFIQNNERPLLQGAGSVSKADADRHCEVEYEKFKDIRNLSYLRDDADD